MDTIKISVYIAVGIMFVGLALFQIFPGQFFGFFDASENMLAIGIPALRIISLSFLFAGYNIVVSTAFQALGNGMYSLILSIVRQLFVILPVAYLFAELFGLGAVWWSFFIAEIVAIVFSSFLFKRITRLKIKTLKGNDGIL